ncbi:MAG: hypothetical protein DRJ47_06660 [Thermoprotei archaeon]|nr:MAG: hypothetical protein DRJ47_06660 [Thermoprotei archaeon]
MSDDTLYSTTKKIIDMMSKDELDKLNYSLTTLFNEIKELTRLLSEKIGAYLGVDATPTDDELEEVANLAINLMMHLIGEAYGRKATEGGMLHDRFREVLNESVTKKVLDEIDAIMESDLPDFISEIINSKSQE